MAENSATLNLIIKISDQTGPGIGNVQRQVQSVNQAGQEFGRVFSQAISSASSSFGSFTSLLGSSIPVIGGTIAALGSLGLAVHKVTNYLAESRIAWSHQHQANLEVDAVWKSMKRSIPTAEIRAYASELQEVSTYGDEAIASAARMLATFPNITDKLMKPAMKTMVDYAAFSGQSLQGAALTLGRASEGLTGILRRQGISLSEATKASKNFVDIMKDINEQVGGQAQVRASTWVGKITQMKNAYGDLQEQVGRIQFEGFVGFFDPITKRFSDLTNAMAKAFEEGKYNALIAKLKELAKFAEETVQGLIDVAVTYATRFKEFLEKDETIPRIISFLRSMGQTIKTVADWAAYPTALYVAFRLTQGIITSVASVFGLLIGKIGAAVSAVRTETQALAMNSAAWERNAQARVMAAAVPAIIRGGQEGLLPPSAAGQPVPSPLKNAMETGGRLKVGTSLATGGLVTAGTAAMGASWEESLKAGGVWAAFTFIGTQTDKLAAKGKALFDLLKSGFISVTARALAFASALPAVASAITAVKAALAGITVGALAIPAAIGAAIGAVVAAGVVYLGGWRRDAKAVEKDIDESGKRMADNARKRGADISNGIKAITKPDIEGKSIKELNDTYRQNSLNLQAALAERSRFAEGSPEFAQFTQMIEQGRANGKVILEQRDAQQKLNTELGKMTLSGSFGNAAKTAKTFKEALKEISDQLESMLKVAEVYFNYLRQTDEIKFQELRNEIAATSRSAEDAARRMTDIEIQEANKRIQRAQEEYEFTRQKKEDAYNDQMQRLAADEKAAGKNEAQLKQIQESRAQETKKYTDEMIKDEEKYTNAVQAELKKQEAEIQKHYEKLRDLKQSLADAAVAGAQALRDITSKSLSEADRVAVKFGEVKNLLERASQALPNMPQKAIELATQARSMTAGLVQDINALKLSLADFNRSTAESYLNIAKKGMTPIEAWKADMQMVLMLEQQAREAAASGDLETAQKLSGQAAQKAQGLANAPKGVSNQEAMRVAKDMFLEAAQMERDFRLQIIAREEQRQKQAEALAQKSTVLQQTAIDRQIETENQLIMALKANTAALQARQAELQGKRIAAGPQGPKETAAGRATGAPEGGAPGAPNAQETAAQQAAIREADRQIKEQQTQIDAKRRSEAAAESRRKTSESGAAAWRESAPKPEETSSEAERKAALSAGAIAGGPGSTVSSDVWRRKTGETAAEYNARLNKEVGQQSVWHQRRPGETDEEWKFRVQQMQEAQGAFQKVSENQGDKYLKLAEEAEAAGDTTTAEFYRRRAGAMGVSRESTARQMRKGLSGAAEEAAAAMGSSTLVMDDTAQGQQRTRQDFYGSVNDTIEPRSRITLPAEDSLGGGGGAQGGAIQGFQKAVSMFMDGVREYARTIREPIEVRARVNQEAEQFT